MFGFIAFISLANALPQSNVITLPETVIVVRSIAQQPGKLVHCSATRALENDSVQTVRVCEVSK